MLDELADAIDACLNRANKRFDAAIWRVQYPMFAMAA